MSTSFSLSELVRQVIRTAQECDPPRLAKLVKAALPAEHLEDAVDQMLPGFLQNVLSRDRMHHTPPTVRPADQTSFDAQRANVGGADPVSSSYSARRRALRSLPPQEWWRGEQLDKPYNVGPGRHDWKWLRDCTVADLRYVQDHRHRLAAANAAAADRLGVLIAQMIHAHADTVGALDRTLARVS